jgi:hypothetical protein
MRTASWSTSPLIRRRCRTAWRSALLQKRRMPCLCSISGFSRGLVIALSLFAGDLSRGWSETVSTAPNVVGHYSRIGPAIVALVVSARDGVVEARLEGGGSPSSDGSVPADCIVQAAGQLDAQLLIAIFQPVETDNFSYSAAWANAEKRKVIVAFAPGTAEVKQADTDGYCGIGIDFRGLYRKTD